MCIIACKPIGLAMPTEETIANMWSANPDGAGFMYSHNGQVHIEKGYMKLDDLLDALKSVQRSVDLTNCGVVMHFRITTHGGTRPENTHPFPISSNMAALKKLRFSTDVGVAHNGIIHITPRGKDISDTMEYVVSQLAPLKAALPRFWENKDAMLLVKNAIQSKMAFLDSAGVIHTIGDFVTEGGMLYSNHSYEDYWKTTSYTGYWDWEFKNGKWNRSTYVPCSKTSIVRDDEFDTGADDAITPHYLMPLTDVDGGYYADADGNMCEDLDYEVYIDYKGRAWVLDWEAGVAFMEDSIVGVYGPEGMRLPYDAKHAELVDCYGFDDILYLPGSDKDKDKGKDKKGGKK